MGKGEHVGHKKKSQECNCINCKCKPRVGERYAKNTDLLKSHIPVGTEGNYSTTFQSDYTKKPLSVADTERENYLTTHFAMGTVPTDYDTHNSVLYNGKGGKPSTPIRMAETAYKSVSEIHFKYYSYRQNLLNSPLQTNPTIKFLKKLLNLHWTTIPK